MKLALIGDMHITDKKPFCRKDEDYFRSCLNKLEQVLCRDAYHKILQAGDFFDHYQQSNIVLSQTMNLLYGSNKPIHACYGQHDMKFHSSDVSDTALNILVTCQSVNVRDSKTPAVSIYKCNYGAEIPKIANSSSFNVLIIHKMIVNDAALYPGQEGHSFGYAFLQEHNFDLILSGDNHQTFTVINGNKTLINPGCMMRKSIDLKEHKPCFFIFETDTRTFEQIYFNVQDDVFIDMDKTPLQKVFDSEKIQELLVLLKTKAKLEGVDFVDNLTFLSKDQTDEIKTLLQESIK